MELRIFGPPGTGKTTTLARQIARVSARYGHDEVLVASFSKAAASELVARDLPISPDHVGTLHALCYRVLGKPIVAEAKLKDWNAHTPELALTSTHAGSIDEPASEWEFEGGADEAYTNYHLLRHRLVPREQWPLSVKHFAIRWESWKQSIGAVDFTDMIELVYRSQTVVPGPIRVAIFDEFQDFSALESALARKWGAEMEHFLVAGDDDQVLYSFRGASPDSLLSPLPAEQIRVLAQSYRVPEAVHAYAQRWIQQIRRRQPKDYRPRDYPGELRRLSAGTWKNPEALVEDAHRYLAQGKTVMMLATCGYLLSPLINYLREQGVPYHNPFRPLKHTWNPLSPAAGTSTLDRVLAFLRPSTDVWGDEAVDWRPTDLKQFIPLLRAKNVLRKGVKTHLDVIGDDLSPLDIDQLSGVFEDDALIAAATLSLEWLRDNCMADKRRALDYITQIAQARGSAALRDTPRLIVGTGHSVKGGEADVVYVLPDLSQSAYDEWESASEGHDSIVRLVYVMATRARESLVLCEPASGCAVTL